MKTITPDAVVLLGALYRIAIVSETSYHPPMKGITIKLPEATLRRIKDEARATGRSVAALVRDRLEARQRPGGRSVHALASDLAGCVAGSRAPATNARRRFRRG